MSAEALDSNCFALLTSFLYVNELAVLRRVCRSFAIRLGDPKTFAFLVSQPQAIQFPAQWYEEYEVCGAHIQPYETEKESRLAQKSTEERIVGDGKESQMTTWPHCRQRLSNCEVAVESFEKESIRACVALTDRERVWEQEGDGVAFERHRKATSFLNEYISVRPCGLRHLSIHWTGGVSWSLCDTFRRLLTTAAPTLETLSTVGSSLAMWRCAWPLELVFPRLTQLTIDSDCGNPHVRYYQDCLDWHFLSRCQFPACKGLRWFDSFVWDGDDDDIPWHEIVLHQLNCLFSLLSSMGELRHLAFTADSRYTITQVLVYLASRPFGSVEELEIVPATRNCDALERDWLLPQTYFGSSVFDGVSATLQSVRQICFVLNDCELHEFVQTGILAFVKRVCPRGHLLLAGTVRLTMSESGTEGCRCARRRRRRLRQRRCCEHVRCRCVTSDHVKEFIQSQSIAELHFNVLGTECPASVTVTLSRPGVTYPTEENASFQRCTLVPSTVSLEVARPLPRLPPCLSQHIEDIIQLLPGILLRLEGDRRHMDQLVNMTGFFRNLVGLEIGLSGGQPRAPTEELLALASKYGRWQARVVRLYDLWKWRVDEGSSAEAQGVLGRLLDSLVHDACPNVSVIEYRLVGPASWQRESGVQRGIPALSENMLRGFCLHQRIDIQIDGGADAQQLGRSTGHVTVLVYRRRQRPGAEFEGHGCFHFP
ncbi:UNVERIFIED_CONTAM: hypothetical protein HHA_450990 [Hammondia hammondi]|eukprot:XP_008883509.1 hypothetical protein HHA_450990 [Hammondia hammondi]